MGGDARGRFVSRLVAHGRAAATMLVVLATGASASASANPLTREEALALAFPRATIAAERVFLTPAQRERAASLAGEKIPSALVARYVATGDGQVVGRAYVDTSVVRTKKETLLVSLDAAGRVRRIDVTAFLEPIEYAPPEPWLKQYEARGLTDDLALNRAIRPIAGATLTARAVTSAVRRILAIDAVLQAGGTP